MGGNKSFQKSQQFIGAKDSNSFHPISLVVILTSLAIAPFTFDAFVIPKILVLYVGITIVGMLLYKKSAKVMQLNRLPLWYVSLFGALAVFLICSAIVSHTPLLRSMFGQFGRGIGLFYYFGALVILLLTAKTYSNKHEPRFSKLMTYVCVFLGLYAILQTLGIDIAKMNTSGVSRVVLTYGNSNFAGGMLSILFGFMFTRSVRSKTLNLKDLAISLLLLFGVYKSGAVQGYLIVLFVVLVIVPIRLVALRKNKIWKLCLYSSWGIGSILTVLGALGIGPISRVFERYTFQARIEYWKIGFRVLRDNLLFGVGPDRLYDITPLYMTPGSLNVITTTRMDSPHNWFLSFACSFGIIAMVLLMILIAYPVITFLKKSDLDIFLSHPNAPSFIALLCLLIDGLVSIEQTGLGIWMYFFAGKILASAQTPWRVEDSFDGIYQGSQGTRQTKVILTFTLVLTLSSTIVIMDRFFSDAMLRSSVQSVVLGSQAKSDFKNIETFTNRLKAEPEYVIQAVPQLAKIGDKEALLSISKAHFEYNENSFQAAAIRFQVLNAVSSSKNSCPLLPSLLQNTPWESTFVENYIYCIDEGYFGAEKKSLLKLIERYISVSFPISKENEVSPTNLKSRAVYAHLQFQLGKIELARLLQQQTSRDLKEFEVENPYIEISMIGKLLNF